MSCSSVVLEGVPMLKRCVLGVPFVRLQYSRVGSC